MCNPFDDHFSGQKETQIYKAINSLYNFTDQYWTVT